MDKFIELSTRIVEDFTDGLIGRSALGRDAVNKELWYLFATDLGVNDKFYLDKIFQKWKYYTEKGAKCPQKRHHIEWLWHYIWDLKLINEFWQDKKGDTNE